MTKKDESPEEATNPYWSDELLAVLAEALGDEDRARQTLEGIIQQAQEGKAMQTLSTESGWHCISPSSTDALQKASKTLALRNVAVWTRSLESLHKRRRRRSIRRTPNCWKSCWRKESLWLKS